MYVCMSEYSSKMTFCICIRISEVDSFPFENLVAQTNSVNVCMYVCMHDVCMCYV